MTIWWKIGAVAVAARFFLLVVTNIRPRYEVSMLQNFVKTTLIERKYWSEKERENAAAIFRIWIEAKKTAEGKTLFPSAE